MTKAITRKLAADITDIGDTKTVEEEDSQYTYQHIASHYIDARSDAKWYQLCSLLSDQNFLIQQSDYFNGLDHSTVLLEKTVLPEAIRRKDWPHFNQFYLTAQNFRKFSVDLLQQPILLQVLGRQDDINLIQGIIKQTEDPFLRIAAYGNLLAGRYQAKDIVKKQIENDDSSIIDDVNGVDEETNKDKNTARQELDGKLRIIQQDIHALSQDLNSTIKDITPDDIKKSTQQHRYNCILSSQTALSVDLSNPWLWLDCLEFITDRSLKKRLLQNRLLLHIEKSSLCQLCNDQLFWQYLKVASDFDNRLLSNGPSLLSQFLIIDSGSDHTITKDLVLDIQYFYAALAEKLKPAVDIPYQQLQQQLQRIFCSSPESTMHPCYLVWQLSIFSYAWQQQPTLDLDIVLIKAHIELTLGLVMEFQLTDCLPMLQHTVPDELAVFRHRLNTLARRLHFERMLLATNTIAFDRVFTNNIEKISDVSDSRIQWQLYFSYYLLVKSLNKTLPIAKPLRLSSLVSQCKYLQYDFSAQLLVSLLMSIATSDEYGNQEKKTIELCLDILYNSTNNGDKSLAIIKALNKELLTNKKWQAVVYQLFNTLLEHVESLAAHLSDTEAEGFKLRFQFYQTIMLNLVCLTAQPAYVLNQKSKLLPQEYQQIIQYIIDYLLEHRTYFNKHKNCLIALNNERETSGDGKAKKFINQLKLEQYTIASEELVDIHLKVSELYDQFVNIEPVRANLIELWTLLDNPDNIYEKINTYLSQDQQSPNPQALLNLIEHALKKINPHSPTKKQQVKQLINLLQSIFYEPNSERWLGFIASLLRIAQYRSNSYFILEYAAALNKILDTELLEKYPKKVLQIYHQLLLELPQQLNIESSTKHIASVLRLYRLTGVLLVQAIDNTVNTTKTADHFLKPYLKQMAILFLHCYQQLKNRWPLTEFSLPHRMLYKVSYVSLYKTTVQLIESLFAQAESYDDLSACYQKSIESWNRLLSANNAVAELDTQLQLASILYFVQYRSNTSVHTGLLAALKDFIDNLPTNQKQSIIIRKIELWIYYWLATDIFNAQSSTESPTITNTEAIQFAVLCFSELLSDDLIELDDPQYQCFIPLFWQASLHKVKIPLRRSFNEEYTSVVSYWANQALQHISINIRVSENFYRLWLHSRTRPVLGSVLASKRNTMFKNIINSMRQSSSLDSR